MPAWKKTTTTRKGKFIKLARKKAFQKKGEPKRIVFYAPSKKINKSGKF